MKRVSTSPAYSLSRALFLSRDHNLAALPAVAARENSNELSTFVGELSDVSSGVGGEGAAPSMGVSLAGAGAMEILKGRETALACPCSDAPTNIALRLEERATAAARSAVATSWPSAASTAPTQS